MPVGEVDIDSLTVSSILSCSPVITVGDSQTFVGDISMSGESVFDSSSISPNVHILTG